MEEKKFRYCILYIQDAEISKMKNIIEKHLPKERGEVFYPCMEYYRRDDKKVQVKALFSNYLFLYSNLNIKEVHELVRKHRVEIASGIRELALAERRMLDPNFLFADNDDNKVYDLSDVDADEAAFLDHLRLGNGLLSMSCGYEYEVQKKKKKGEKKQKTEKRYVVMEGPLKIYEDKIRKVDKHNKMAYLKFEIKGRQAQAGFECKPKAHWFPKEDSEIAHLDDGTEFDISELKRSIMTVSRG